MASKFLLFFFIAFGITEPINGFVDSSFQPVLVSSIEFICRFLVGDSPLSCMSIRFKAILCSDTSSCSLIFSRKNKLTSRNFSEPSILHLYINRAINIFDEMILVVSDNDAVGLSCPSRLVRGGHVQNTVGLKY